VAQDLLKLPFWQRGGASCHFGGFAGYAHLAKPIGSADTVMGHCHFGS